MMQQEYHTQEMQGLLPNYQNGCVRHIICSEDTQVSQQEQCTPWNNSKHEKTKS